jgi:hypothetical protein
MDLSYNPLTNQPLHTESDGHVQDRAILVCQYLKRREGAEKFIIG